MRTKSLHILTCLLLMFLTGCRNEEPVGESQPEERIVNVSLGITTRADDVNTSDIPDVLYLWIFNEADNSCLSFTQLDEPQFSGVDIQGNPVQTVDVQLLTTNGTQLKFYVVLNDVTGENDSQVRFDASTSLASLENLQFTLGTYDSDNKVPMSGTADLTIESTSNDYRVEVPAERAVAKLGIYCTKSSSTSSLTINQVTLSKVPDKGYLFEPDDYSSINYSDTGEKLLSELKQIGSHYTGDMPAYSDNSWDETAEENFVEVSSLYLLENPEGVVTSEGGFLQVGGTVSDNRYCITLDYILNGESYTKKIYVSQVERNQYSKIYIRINDAITISTYCQVNSWTEHTMDVPAFE